MHSLNNIDLSVFSFLMVINRVHAQYKNQAKKQTPPPPLPENSIQCQEDYILEGRVSTHSEHQTMANKCKIKEWTISIASCDQNKFLFVVTKD